ncbi:hypothetical protein [Clostridium beijerinckii]|uniref:hypothetical protein n=1 Tax=Clostridium beijerinckii TaxID=1520 RepID=UPI0013611A54|nr:hypothetical protein [Clostridium beijerinckii]MZK53309.1 hypothetical protein [Clostridium beijerinckii]MZK61414.1 hypothetical protein [Clostridium beijerinckii]MZK71656.1 hypothetical protein [Clostridium beijerinckii]MZK77049.1 hypothetical protein [Clostridium beijerinckii]MZK86704.1 hypothetical protein [Clostridium beijerinckii]
MKIKKNLSLEENVIEAAKTKAKKMGFDFSAYITYLINKDVDGAIETTVTTKKEKNTKVSSAIDNILGQM